MIEEIIPELNMLIKKADESLNNNDESDHGSHAVAERNRGFIEGVQESIDIIGKFLEFRKSIEGDSSEV